MNLLKTEPALIGGLIQAVLVLVVSFGFQLTTPQIAAILALSTAFLALFVRQAVTPNVKVDAIVSTAVTDATILKPQRS